MWTRYLPHMVRIRELVRSGALGEVRTVLADHDKNLPKDACPFRESTGVRPRVVEPDERAGRFCRKPFSAVGNDDAFALTVTGQLFDVGPVGQADPEIEPSPGNKLNVGLRCVLAQARDQQVAA